MSRGKLLAVSAVVAVVAAGIALLIAGVGTATADEVRFQTVSEQGPDPFTAPAEAPKDTTGGGPSTDGTAPSGGADSADRSTGETGGSTPSGETSPTGGSGGDTGGGDQPGTFGGTGKDAVCDREKLISELSGDPNKLKAWAETADVDPTPEAVSAYIRKLRPATLTEDTQVTNHSFSGGQANPYQAILQKGTAVLVDEQGKPVTRCRCGNPLAEPLQLEQNVQCINCPPNYQPPPPCDAKCYRPEPEAPPVYPPGQDPFGSAKEALDACRKNKDSHECKAAYEKAKELCSKAPYKDRPECKELEKEVEPLLKQEEQKDEAGQEPDTGQDGGETTGTGGTDTGTTGGETAPPGGGTTGETTPPEGGTGTP